MEMSTSETCLLERPFICGQKMIRSNGQRQAIRAWSHPCPAFYRMPLEWAVRVSLSGNKETVDNRAHRQFGVMGRFPPCWPSDSAFRDLKHHCRAGCGHPLPSMTILTGGLVLPKKLFSDGGADSCSSSQKLQDTHVMLPLVLWIHPEFKSANI